LLEGLDCLCPLIQREKGLRIVLGQIRLFESTIFYLKAQIAGGVDAFQLFESWAGVLPEHY
jgi:uroporphyrinogen-III decarboxylase